MATRRASPGEGRPYQRSQDGRWVVAVRDPGGRRRWLYGWSRAEVIEKRDEAAGRGDGPSDGRRMSGHRRWSTVRRQLDPQGRAKVDELKARAPELAAKRDAAIDAIAAAMHYGQGYLFEDATRDATERRPQAMMLLEAIEDLGSAGQRAIAGYLMELVGGPDAANDAADVEPELEDRA